METTSPPLARAECSTSRYLSGGTATYEVHTSGVHALTFTGARLCDAAVADPEHADPAVDCVSTSPVVLELRSTVTPGDEVPGRPGAVLVNGVPRCVWD